MMWGFESLKDLLDVWLIPMVGGAIALAWPELQRGYRRSRFEYLIVRELEELKPYPSELKQGLDSWEEYLQRHFLHERILKDASKNRDFILSLDPDLAYMLSQLWVAHEQRNECQWIYFLGKLAEYYTNRRNRYWHRYWLRGFNSHAKLRARELPGKISTLKAQWKELIHLLQKQSAQTQPPTPQP